MNEAQFEALAKLIRIRDGSSREAAYQVLINRATKADAARSTGITPAGVNNVVERILRAHELAKIAAGVELVTE